MQKIYLESTIFNRFLEELDKAPEPKRSEMINLISKYEITVLEID